jgi:hypothetical protein
MEYGMVIVPAAPVRRKARHQREMVSQLLFGEAVRIIKEKGPLWVKVKSVHDEYEGWMTRTLLEEVTEDHARRLPEQVTSDRMTKITFNDQSVYVPIGSSLPGLNDLRFTIGKYEFRIDGNALHRGQSPTGSRITELTREWLNAPYLWGGRTMFGVDCSGFVQVNYKMMGLDLPRDAWQQAQQGTTVKKLKDALAGDLAFFDDKDEIVHVGILLDPATIIHASGKVRIDTITRKGIIHSDSGKQTHKLRSIQRYF